MNGKPSGLSCHGLKLALCAFLAVPFLSPPSEAASFSCDAAKAPRERMICADPELSRADEKLAIAYKAALDALSEEGRADLRTGEREWLSYTQTVCWIGRKAPEGGSSRNCLMDEYAQRQKQLDNAVVKTGGLVVRRVDRFSVAPSAGPGSGGAHPGFNTTVISLPQIDKPRGEHDAAWNKLIAEHRHGDMPLASAAGKRLQ